MSADLGHIDTACYALSMLTIESAMTPEAVAESLVAHGAPLAGWAARSHATCERTIIEAIRQSHDNATLLRVLPVVLRNNVDAIDWVTLRRGAAAAGVRNELAMLVDLTAELTGNAHLVALLSSWDAPDATVTRPWFPERTRFDAELAALRSPRAALRWGFRMNMSEASFRSVLEKHP